MDEEVKKRISEIMEVSAEHNSSTVCRENQKRVTVRTVHNGKRKVNQEGETTQILVFVHNQANMSE